MTDKDVERELAENEQRAEEAAENHEGGFVKSVEGFFEPVVELIDELDGDAEKRRAEERASEE